MSSRTVLWLAEGAPDSWKIRREEDGWHLFHDSGAEAFDRFREDAEQFLRDAAAADTHSSDVYPGAVDPWEDK